MYLKKLEILGFKSFPNKTTVVFDRGITAIVGPNGCGKTNIVDAIRWCLGEQKSRTLRLEKMENVIFNGTSKKKPMGLAEVSLTIENDKGVLPTEYKEVIITRRIFSSGESEYLLNKNVSRLKDITNLFMDTGMGANAYSVIELKMVDSILSPRTDERRILFEEAAGVNKYKTRRKLTLKKLEDVKADLTRVSDIVSEVEKQTIQLERQAKKADKANELRQELTEKEMGLAQREYTRLHAKQLEWNRAKEELNLKKNNAKENLTTLDEEIHSVKSSRTEIEQQLRDKRNELAAFTEKIHKNEQTISVSQEGRRSLERNIDKFSQEVTELEEQLEIAQDTVEENTGKLADINNSIEKQKADKENISAEVDRKRSVLEEKGKELKEFSEQLMQQFKEDTGKQSELNSLVKESQRVDTEIQKLNVVIQNLTGDIAKTVGYIEELSEEREQIKANVDRAEKVQQQKQQEKESLEKSLTALQRKELEQKSSISELRNKIDFLQSLIDNLEGFSKGTKALLETDEWSGEEKFLLANIGKTDEKYQFAIEAALKNNLNNIIVSSLDEIKEAVAFLSKDETGKASFLVYQGDEKAKSLFDKIDRFVTKRRIQKLEKEEGFVTWAADVVQTEARWKPFFRKLLVNTAVIDSLENALALSKQYPLFNFTTLTGDVVYQSGVIEAGSEPKLDDTLFGRKQLLENLKKELPGYEEDLEKMQGEIDELKKRISDIDLKALAEKVKFLFNDLTTVEKQIAQFEFEKGKAVDDTEKARDEIQKLVNQSNSLRAEIEALESVIENRTKEKEEAERKQDSLKNAHNDIQREYNDIVGAINEMNLQIERLYGNKKNTESAIQRTRESIQSIERGINKRREDIESSKEEMTTLNEIIAAAEDELQELLAKRDTIKREEAAVDEKYVEIRDTIADLEERQEKFRREIDSVGTEIHACEMNQREIEINTKNLLEKIREKYNKPLELKEFDDLESYDFKSSRQEVADLEQKLKNIGPVNSIAYEEYEEEKQRLDFLLKQRNDLIQSEKDLLKTIDEINTKAKILFTETFELIRANFINIFQRLFNPGDEADLRLEENVDPLEAGINIIAKPRGKRPTSIELLSGGEKTLTAIALLFAIYLVKPSPFCILDEIDAPLDDANIDRFSKILRDFSKNTQFITVTHNKRTMEMADILYGVTMQEEGISKLVSVKFNEDFNIVA